MKQLALQTLYANYQVLKKEKRAEMLYLYFNHYAFKNLHMEEIFHVGREASISQMKVQQYTLRCILLLWMSITKHRIMKR